MCQGLGPKEHDEISEIDRIIIQGLHRLFLNILTITTNHYHIYFYDNDLDY